MGKIEEMVKDLPPNLRQEVEDFIEFLIHSIKHDPEKRVLEAESEVVNIVALSLLRQCFILHSFLLHLTEEKPVSLSKVRPESLVQDVPKP